MEKRQTGQKRGRVGGRRVNTSKAPIKRHFSAGGVVYKRLGEQLFFLISRSANTKNYPKTWWRLQKGWLDDEKDGPGPLARGDKKASEVELRNAALREVEEEGGVKAKIVKKIGTISFFFNSNEFGSVLKFVTYYLMEYLKDKPEKLSFETAETKWLEYEEARKVLSISGEKKVLDNAMNLIYSGSLQV